MAKAKETGTRKRQKEQILTALEEMGGIESIVVQHDGNRTQAITATVQALGERGVKVSRTALENYFYKKRGETSANTVNMGGDTLKTGYSEEDLTLPAVTPSEMETTPDEETDPEELEEGEEKPPESKEPAADPLDPLGLIKEIQPPFTFCSPQPFSVSTEPEPLQKIEISAAPITLTSVKISVETLMYYNLAAQQVRDHSGGEVLLSPGAFFDVCVRDYFDSRGQTFGLIDRTLTGGDDGGKDERRQGEDDLDGCNGAPVATAAS